MRKKYPSIVRVLVVLAMVVALTGVLVVAPVSAQTAGLSITAGPVGASVTVTATGYAANSILTATFDGAAATTAPTVVETSGTGTATFAMLVPTATAGAHFITVTDGVNSDTNTFTIQPKVKISPTSGSVGTSATVTGTGFAAGYTVNVTVGGAGFGSAVTDSAGGFTATGTIPAGLAAGAQTVTAADLAGNNANANPATFTVRPSLALTPSSGLAGATVAVSGSGWAPGNVALTFAGVFWANVTASGTGVVSANVATPATAAPGVTQVTGTDVSTNTAAASFTVNPRPLNISPSSGPMGTTVLLTASSMSPNGNIAVGAMTIAGGAWSTAIINIGTAGEMFPTSLVVPAGLTVGANTVRGTDNNGLVCSGSFTVTKPTVAVSPTTGPRGSSTTITGAGWVPNSTVTLNFAGSPMTVIADSNGNIAAAMSVPAGAAIGANAITAVDTNGNSATPASYVVPGASISVSPTEGGPGETVTISGTGFAGYAAITVMFGGYTLPANPLSSPLGDFTLATTVPGVAPGSQVVQAQDGTSLATTFFVVTRAPETVQTALAGIMDVLDIIWDYAGGDWLFYDPGDTAGSDLTGLSAGTGYWVKVSEDTDLIYGGHSYSLVSGWNNIGWLGA